MGKLRLAVLDPDHAIHVPIDWAREDCIQGLPVLERTPQRILIRPRAPLIWDEVFAHRLALISGEGAALRDLGDDGR